MQPARLSFKAMGCPCAVSVHGPERRTRDAARTAIAEVRRLEHKYSRYRDDSVTAQIARSAGERRGLRVDDETAALLDYAALLHEQSGGLFDITSGVLRRAWDFRSGRIPSARELAKVRERTGWQHVRWERSQLVLTRPGMELDFGGYVKEYAVDRACEQLRARGVRSALVDLGGDLRALGPQPGGEPWIAGIRDPRRPAEALRRVGLGDAALATSGDYERGMVVGGRRYGHILNPLTGWPVESWVSVSVLAGSCLVAGSASTLAMLMGERDGARWLAELGLPSLTLGRDGAIGDRLGRPDATVSSRSAA